MTDTQKTNVKNTVKVARRHAVGVITSTIFGYIIWSAIYAGVIFGGIWYGLNHMDFDVAYPGMVWLGGTILYGLVLVLTFVLRIRGIMNSFKEAALDAAEEVITSSDNKHVKAGAKGFKILRWFVG